MPCTRVIQIDIDTTLEQGNRQPLQALKVHSNLSQSSLVTQFSIWGIVSTTGTFWRFAESQNGVQPWLSRPMSRANPSLYRMGEYKNKANAPFPWKGLFSQAGAQRWCNGEVLPYTSVASFLSPASSPFSCDSSPLRQWHLSHHTVKVIEVSDWWSSWLSAWCGKG